MKRGLKPRTAQNNQKGNTSKRRLLVVLIAVLLFVGSLLATVGIYSYFHPESNLFTFLKAKPEPEDPENIPVLKERFNLLVLGVDEREDDLGRSDTMIFLSIPSDGSAPVLISIPRDTMIFNETWQIFDRINNVFPLSGIEASVQEVKNLFSLPVNGYIKLNIEGFVDLVDIMGGVRLHVDEQMDYDDPYQDLYIHIMPGDQTLDGKTAMEYVRYRSDGTGDIGRISRQQKFLTAAMEQALSLSNITRIPGMIKQGLSMIETDLNLAQLLTLANTVIKASNTGLESITLPGQGLYYGDASMYMLDLEDMYETLAQLLVPEEQREKYLTGLNQPWAEEYQKIHEDSLAWATFIWEETGMWLSEREYAALLESLKSPVEEPDGEIDEDSNETIDEDESEAKGPNLPDTPEPDTEPETPITPITP